MISKYKIGLVIPCFNTKKKILKVLKNIPKFVDLTIVVDDYCPENTGKFVLSKIRSKKILVHFNEKNMGVGGAVLNGYKILLKNNCDILVKIDGDNQMQQSQMIKLIKPIISLGYDYVKGNRFLNQKDRRMIPTFRFYGNYLISLYSKIASGYWDIFDFLNGFTVIKSKLAIKIVKMNIDNKFFFETDVLFKLNILEARVKDIGVSINYKKHTTNFFANKEAINFLTKNIHRFCLRILNKYFIKSFSFLDFVIINILTSLISFITYTISTHLLNDLSGPVLEMQKFLLFYFIFFASIFIYFDFLNNPNNKK